MKKSIRIFLAIICIIGLAGCESKKIEVSTVTSQEKTVEQSQNVTKAQGKENEQDKKASPVKTNTTTKEATNNSENSTKLKEVASKSKNSIESTGKQAKEAFYGQWVIKKQLAYGPAGTYSNEDIKNMIGKKLNFSKERASCFGDQISDLSKILENPVYKKSVISKSDFETNNRITFDSLGIKNNSVTEITVVGSKDAGCIFYIKDVNTLIIYGGGVCLELNRV